MTSPAREPDAPANTQGTGIPGLLQALACDKGLHHEHAHAMVQGMVARAEPHHGGDDSPQGQNPCSHGWNPKKGDGVNRLSLDNTYRTS